MRPGGNHSERAARFARPDSHKWKPTFIDCLKILNNISPDCARYLIPKLHYAMHSCCKDDTVGQVRTRTTRVKASLLLISLGVTTRVSSLRLKKSKASLDHHLVHFKAALLKFVLSGLGQRMGFMIQKIHRNPVMGRTQQIKLSQI